MRDRLITFVKRVKDSSSIATEYDQNGLGVTTPLFVHKLLEAKVKGGPVDLKQIPRIFHQLNEERVPRYHPWGSDKLDHLVKTFDTDERMQLWLKRCAEPMLAGDSSDDVHILGIDEILDGSDLDSLLDRAIALEKQHCSWEATIGPVIKAIRRLGRMSDGKDYENLASYARQHQKSTS